MRQLRVRPQQDKAGDGSTPAGQTSRSGRTAALLPRYRNIATLPSQTQPGSVGKHSNPAASTAVSSTPPETESAQPASSEQQENVAESPRQDDSGQQTGEDETSEPPQAGQGETENGEEDAGQQQETDQEAATGERSAARLEQAERAGADERQSRPATAPAFERTSKKVTGILQAVPIPRLGIRTPFVGSPPKPSMERRDEIQKSTGYTPEMHHAKVRDAVQRTTQQARDAQRQMVIRVEGLARDSSWSAEQLAEEIPDVVAAAIAFIDRKIVATKSAVTAAGDQYAGHIRNHGVLVGEQLEQSRKETTTRIMGELTQGAEHIEEANRVIQQQFDNRLGKAEGIVRNLPVTGTAPRIPAPSKPGAESEGETSSRSGRESEALQQSVPGAGPTTINEAYSELTDFLGTAAGESSVPGERLKEYKLSRATPVLQQIVSEQEIDLMHKQDERAGQLGSEANRAQFQILALGLTAPLASTERHDENDTSDTAEEQGTENQRQSLSGTERAAMEIERRASSVNERLQGDTRDGFVKNLRKTGRKVRKTLLEQGQAAASALTGAAADMADAYRDLVGRIEEMLPPGRFLDARQLLPRLQKAAASARTLRVSHVEAAQQQALQIHEQLLKVQQESIKGLWKQARKSGDSLGDVISQSRFDFLLFAEQMTGANTEGRDLVIGQARSYADRMAENVLKNSRNVDERGIPRLDSLAVQFLNQNIAGAEAWQHQYLKRFVDAQSNIPNGVFWQIFLQIESDLNRRADAINDAVPKTGSSLGGAVISVAAGGLVGLGVYLYSKDADEDVVITQLGDLPWPGAGGLQDVFAAKRYGDLHDRLDATMDDPERGQALALLSEAESARAEARLAIARDSTRWFGYNRQARESALRGLSEAERGTLNSDDIASVRDALQSDLNGSEEEISLAYLQGNRERALAARMREAFTRAHRQGSNGMYSVAEARHRGDQAMVDAALQIETLARTELAFETAHISDARLRSFTNQAFHEFAAMEDSRHRAPGAFSDAAARNLVVGHIVADRTVVVGSGGYKRIEQVSPSPAAEQFIRDVIQHGGDSDQARLSRAAFEIERADAEGGSLSETTQMRLTQALEDPEYYDLVRRERDETNPEVKAQLTARLAEARAARQRRMQQLAARLKLEGAESLSPAQAEDLVTKHVAQLFEREGSEHARYGRELIQQGRASMEAGIALATGKLGTHEDLLLHTYRGRTQEEIEQVRRNWQAHHHGEDLDEMLGIKERQWDAADYAALAAMPVLGPGPALAMGFARGGEVSGDVAMQLQQLARGPVRTDADAVNMAALRYDQQQRGTGFIADITMHGTPQQAVMDERRRRMGELLLAAAEVQDPVKAARFRANPDSIFSDEGTINPDLQQLAFDNEGEFRGDRMALNALAHGVGLAADSYQREIDRQESILTTALSVLTIAVSIALLFIPGVNVVAAGILTALIGGAATMAVKFGMRGERYGWEEAAQDMAMTGIEAATAGIGGAMAGGLGKTGLLFRAGDAINGAFGKIGGAAVREAITGAMSSAAQVAIQDETWKDGLGRGFDHLLAGGLKGAAVGAVSAGVSEKLGDSLDDAMRAGMTRADDLARMQRLGQVLGPNGREILKESISEAAGSASGEGVAIMSELATGEYRGGLEGALQRIGQAGLRDMVSSAGRAGARGRQQSRYRDLMAQARANGGRLSASDVRALRLAAISAGVMHYDDPVSRVRQEVEIGQRALQVLPPALRSQVDSLDGPTLQHLAEMLSSGDLGKPGERLEFIRGVAAQIPDLDQHRFLRDLNDANRTMRDVDARQAAEKVQQKRVRRQLLGGVPGPARKALRNVSIDGLERLPEADISRAAEMIASGRFDDEAAGGLLRQARKADPELNEVAFLKNLQTAVAASRQAQDAEAAIAARRREEVLEVMPEAAAGVIGRMSDGEVARVQWLISQRGPASSQQIDSLYGAVRKQNPELSREQFHKFISDAAAEVHSRAAAQRERQRNARQQRMSNVPKEVRGVLSALPDEGLIELRLRQMQGGISPAEKQRLLDLAQRETPDADLHQLSEALDKAIAVRPVQRMPAAEEKSLRRELLAAVPEKQRNMLDEVRILMLPVDEFVALTRSAKGQAATLIIRGEPVVVVREGAQPAVLREEGIHALQAKDPRWTDRLGALDESRLADWDKLSLEEQLTLYGNKMALEVDAQQRLIASLETELAGGKDKKSIDILRQRLQLAQATLANLQRRHAEVSGIDSLDVANIKAGFSERPQWLDQPARLFSKEPDKGKVDTGGIASERQTQDVEAVAEKQERAAIARRLAADVTDKTAKNYQDVADRMRLQDLRIIAEAASSSDTLRGLLARIGRTEQLGDYPGKLGRVLSTMTPEQRHMMAEHWSSTSTKNFQAFVDGLSRLRSRVDSDADLQRLLDTTLGTDQSNKNKILQEHLDLLVGVVEQVGSEAMRSLLTFVHEPANTRAIIKLTDQVDNPLLLVQQFVHLMQNVDTDRLESMAGWLAGRNSRVAIDVITRFDQLRQTVPSVDTFRAMIDVVMAAPARRGEVLDHLIGMSRSLDIDGRRALAGLIAKSDKGTRADILDALLMYHDVTMKRIQQVLDPDNPGRLLNLVIEMAATRSQWIVFIDQTLDFLGTLTHLPKNQQNNEAIRKILDYLYQTKTNATESPEVRQERILQLAADITAAAKALRGPESSLRGIEERNEIILRQVEHLSENKSLAEQNAWKFKVREAVENWPEFSKLHPDFVHLLSKAAPTMTMEEYALLAEIQPWFDLLVRLKERQDGKKLQADEKTSLLSEMLDYGMLGRNAVRRRITNPSVLAKVLREFRREVVGHTEEPAFNQLVKRQLDELGIRDLVDDRRALQDRLLQEVHVENLIRQQIEYERIIAVGQEMIREQALKEGWSEARLNQALNDVATRFKAQLTEVRGEIQAFAAIIRADEYRDLSLLQGFEAGRGFDQVWIKYDMNGRPLRVLIVEAKGPGAELGNPAKGPQMSAKWVANTIKELLFSSDPAKVVLGSELLKALEIGAEISGVKVEDGVISGVEDSPGNGHYDLALLRELLKK